MCPGGGMVDTYVSDAYALSACGFKSHSGHQKKNKTSDFLKFFLAKEEIFLYFLYIECAQVVEW